MADNSEKYFGERKKVKQGKPGQSYPHRLLTALEKIFDDPNASIAERLQALELSAKILPMRNTPRKKTDKEKLIIQALKGKQAKKEVEPKSDPNPE